MAQRRTILITGSGNGIGRASLGFFHERDWRVIGLDTDAEALDELRGELPRDEALLLPCDCGDEGAVREAFGQIARWLGEDSLHCLVNNAGLADPYCGPLEKLQLADWRRWIDASLTAAFLCSRAALPLLRRAAETSGGASICNISSTRALQSEPDSFAYAAAKGGLDALTHALAVSLGPAIRVNAIRPGWIEVGPWQKASERKEPERRPQDRAQHPVGRIGRPRDIAEAIAWLHGAGFVTGQAINIDGGMSVKMIYEE